MAPCWLLSRWLLPLRERKSAIAVFVAVAAISGLADVDAVHSSVARFGEVSSAAVNAILAAVAVNTFAKGAYAWLVGGTRLGLLTIGGSALALLAAAAAWLRFQV